ncbi:Outer envelope pore protein 37 [Ranunculus cassubicifolius]
MEEPKPVVIITPSPSPSPSIQTLPNPNPNPNPNQSPPPPQKFSFPPRPPIRLTSEFDSDGGGQFFHKVSCKLFDSLAKLKLSFQQSKNREISDPQIGLITKHVSVFYDVEEQNTFVKGNFNFGDKLQFRAAQDIKAQEGEVAMVASFSDPSYKLELASVVPSVGLPRATLKFPLGEVSVDTIEREVEGEEEEVSRALSISGIVKGQALNGICTAQYKADGLNLRYLYKDEEMTFIPSISVPRNSVSFAFKRRLSMSDKLSYWYNFDSNNWSTVYKHTIGKDLKLKAGYDSDVRLGWAALWVGDETGKAKTAPMKTKLQVMLQVPQDDIKSSVVLLRVKKRWDF